MFTTTPDVAKRQAMQDVREIADYRLARTAAELWRQGAQGIEALARAPGAADMLVRMQRALNENESITVDHVYEAMRNMPQPDDEDDE